MLRERTRSARRKTTTMAARREWYTVDVESYSLLSLYASAIGQCVAAQSFVLLWSPLCLLDRKTLVWIAGI